MAIDKETVFKTAKLARLKIDNDKVELYTQELSKIIDVIDTLKSANTDDIEPMTNVNEYSTPTRKDEVTDGNCTQKIFKNAPKEKFDYFLVPKVID